MTAIDDNTMKVLMRTLLKEPAEGLEDTGDSWEVGIGPRIHKRRATFSDGFGCELHPKSHFYKRWFEFPDTKQRGWAIIFQVAPPAAQWGRRTEYFSAWVPPEREQDADRWIEFLNAEIQDRLETAAARSAP